MSGVPAAASGAQILRVLWARAIRRHFFRAQLADDLLPVRGIARNLLEVARLDDELGGEVGRVMAIGAVMREELARRRHAAMRKAEPPRCAERERICSQKADG